MNGVKRVFVDSNVLLYFSDPSDSRRHARAKEWMEMLWLLRNGCISWQVLHEFYANALKKLRVSPAQAQTTVNTLLDWSPMDSSPQLVHRAWYWMDRAKMSYWDALILAAAESTNSTILLTEDFQTGRSFGSVQVVNPFLTSPSDIFPTQ